MFPGCGVVPTGPVPTMDRTERLGVGDKGAMNNSSERTIEYAGVMAGMSRPRGRPTSRASATGPRARLRDAQSATARAMPNSARWGAEHVRGHPVHHGRKTVPGDCIPLSPHPRLDGHQ